MTRSEAQAMIDALVRLREDAANAYTPGVYPSGWEKVT